MQKTQVGSRRKLSLISLAAATYFMVSGGPYGVEELVQDSGYKLALIVLFIIPIFWALPTGLMVGELSAAMPQEGGFYVWVRRAMGPFWGFQEAWLSLVASIFDMAWQALPCRNSRRPRGRHCCRPDRSLSALEHAGC